MAEQPKPLWSIVERNINDRNYHARRVALELAKLLREWHQRIEEGVKQVSSPIGPLHAAGMIEEARSTQRNILGVPQEEPNDPSRT